MYVCVCTAVSDRAIHRAIDHGAHTLQDLMDELGVAMGCGSCESAVRQMLAERVRSLGYQDMLATSAA